MNGIVWLASYPRSGNTWVRLFLANYLRLTEAPVTPHTLDFAPIATSRELLDQWLAIETSELDESDVVRLRSDAYRAVARSTDGPVYLKVHDAYTRLDDGATLFPTDVTTAAVYMIRNPLDVAVSLAYFFDVSLAEAGRVMADSRMQLSAPMGGMSAQVPQQLLSWSGHVSSWTSCRAFPVTVVRYEDLWRNPAMEFARLVRAAGLSVHHDRVEDAVRQTRFERLRASEQRDGYRARWSKVTPFFRAGRVGDGRRELPRDVAEQVIASHGEVMQAFGYIE